MGGPIRGWAKVLCQVYKAYVRPSSPPVMALEPTVPWQMLYSPPEVPCASSAAWRATRLRQEAGAAAFAASSVGSEVSQKPGALH